MATSAIVNYHAFSSTTVKTNIIPESVLPISGILQTELALVDEITVNRSINSHPTATLTLFLVPSSTQTLDEVIEAKFNQYASGTEVELFGIKFIVQLPTVIRKSIRKFSTKTALLKLDLVGKWSPLANTRRQPLDEPYKVENKNHLLLSEAIALAGEGYVGSDIDIFLEGNAKVNIVTPRELLENNARSLKGFVFYSNGNALEIREWGKTPRRQLPLNIVKTQDIEEPRPGFGATVNGLKLVEEFRNTKFVPKKFTGNTGIEILVEYENATNEAEFLAPLYENASWALFGPAALEPFKNGNNAFDNSSQTKKKRTLQVKNGEPLITREEIKGWEYLTTDFYTVTADEITFDPPSILVVNGFWKTVEISTAIKQYDVDGYYLGDGITGNRRTRYKQETGFEAAEAQKEIEANPGDSVLVDIRDTYSFFDFAINGKTINFLEDKGLLYNNEFPNDEGIIPKYLKRSQKTELNLVTAPDPASTDENPLPDMVTGRDFFEEKIVNVTSPKDASSAQSPERFREITYTRNAQGQALSRFAKNGNSREVKGRPDTARRLVNLTGDYVNPSTDLDSGVSYLLVSEGADVVVSPEVERNTISFDNIFNQQALLQVAQVELSKRNTNATSASVSINQYLPWEEGDTIEYNQRDYILQSINFTVKPKLIQGQVRLVNQSFSLRLGAYLLPGVTLFAVTANNQLIELGSV